MPDTLSGFSRAGGPEPRRGRTAQVCEMSRIVSLEELASILPYVPAMKHRPLERESQEGGHMASRKTVGAAVAGLGLVLSSMLATGVIAVARGADPTAPRQAPRWAKHLDTLDEGSRVQLASHTSDRITIPEDI